jgi:hypothetical protein
MKSRAEGASEYPASNSTGDTMNQPESLPRFLFTMRHESGPQPFVATCTMQGDTREFLPDIRRFTAPEEIAAALGKAGIPPDRYAEALSKFNEAPETSFEIDQNEAQKIGVLHTETTE